MDYSYKIGHSYVNKAGDIEDQFLKWVNIPGSGMGNAGGIRALNFVNKKSNFVPAYIILVSNQNTKYGNPWEDIVDLNSSTIKYWGDAKHHEKMNYQSFKGNQRLLQTWHTILDGKLEHVPPILHFSKPKNGLVQFDGLCVMSNLETTWFEDKGSPVKNYRCELTILDIEEVEISWLHYRARCEDLSKLNDSAPKTWKDYILGRTRKLDIWSKSILSKENQLPPEKSKESGILLQLNQLHPTQFEAVVVELFKNLPHVSHKIVRTRPTADGGFDFFGQFTIPYPIKYEIDFLGEAKKFAKNNAVQPKHVSRLVARLNRGQFGIFVTTSYYTKQTQKEVLEDGYPVKLFSGIDLVNIVHELRLVDNGKIKKEWLESVFQKMKINK